MDDEALMYPFYERLQKAGINIVCVHKGLFPPQVEARFPALLPYARVDDVGKAAKDWPGIHFVIYHSAYRFAGGGTAEQGLEQFERTGRVEWVSDLAEIPARYGVTNVYGDLGQIFAQSTVVQPRLAAAMMGMLVKGPGRRPRGLGHGRDLDRLAPVADRGAAPAGDPGGPAAPLRLRAARPRGRAGEDRDLRRRTPRGCTATTQRRAGLETDGRDAGEGAVRRGGRAAEQPRLRLRGAG
jgi:hypothetical protein